ncbi:MAG: squalene--hopene cyclase [Nitrospinota bacterium]
MNQSKIAAKLDQTISGARDYLLSRQNHQEGYWVGELRCDVSVTADYIFLKHVFGKLPGVKIDKAIAWILHNQLDDGGWAIYPGGKSEINVSVKAYFALRVCGISPEEDFMEKAEKKIKALGGIMKTNTFTRILLALFGEYEWDWLPPMPIEMILFSKRFYFNLYEIAYWSRTIIIPLLIIIAKRSVFRLTDRNVLEGLYNERYEERKFEILPIEEKLNFFNLFINNIYSRIDTTLKLLGRTSYKPFRKAALRSAENWIIERLERSGGLGAIWPGMFNSFFAFKSLGYKDTDSPITNTMRHIEQLVVETDNFLRVQPCLSPVWDTAISINALISSGLQRDHPALIKAGTWLLGRQTTLPGDWHRKVRDVESGGWYFQFENEFYPDVDDTAMVIMSLKDIAFSDNSTSQKAIEKGLAWLDAMQNTDGGWGAFDNTNIIKDILNQLPFADFGSILDPSTSDVTGRSLEAMGKLGFNISDEKVKHAVEFLKDEQERSGAWYGRWGVNYIYGTWSVMSAFKSVGFDMNDRIIRRGVEWLKSHQNQDGGWGEGPESYKNIGVAGIGKATPSQTSWAIMALIAADEARCDEVIKGVKYLIDSQNSEGRWEEEAFTGTGFPNVFYLGYEMYSIYFPLMALGNFLFKA